MNKVIQGDCLEVMKKIPDKSIDMILTDPPYNISRETNFHTLKGHRGTSMDYGEWDKGFDITTYIKELPRLLKNGSNGKIVRSQMIQFHNQAGKIRTEIWFWNM